MYIIIYLFLGISCFSDENSRSCMSIGIGDMHQKVSKSVSSLESIFEMSNLKLKYSNSKICNVFQYIQTELLQFNIFRFVNFNVRSNNTSEYPHI